MARAEARDVALLSVRPEFAGAIMRGEKKVEFRRVRFHRDVTHVIVYASSPVRKVLGYFKVNRIEEGSPERIWRKYGRLGRVDRRFFDQYFEASEKAVAILVGAVCRAPKPLPLSKLAAGLPPPQSYTYLGVSALGKIQGNGHPG